MNSVWVSLLCPISCASCAMPGWSSSAGTARPYTYYSLADAHVFTLLDVGLEHVAE